MEQLVARHAHNVKVTGSSPVPATILGRSGGVSCVRQLSVCQKSATSGFSLRRMMFHWDDPREAYAPYRLEEIMDIMQSRELWSKYYGNENSITS